MIHLAWLLPLLALGAVLALARLRGRFLAERRLGGLRRAWRARRRRAVDAPLPAGTATERTLAPRRAARLAGIAVRPPPALAS